MENIMYLAYSDCYVKEPDRNTLFKWCANYFKAADVLDPLVYLDSNNNVYLEDVNVKKKTITCHIFGELVRVILDFKTGYAYDASNNEVLSGCFIDYPEYEIIVEAYIKDLSRMGKQKEINDLLVK